MGKAILAMIVTVIVGFMSSAIFANWVNAPEWGIVLAIAVMGGYTVGIHAEVDENTDIKAFVYDGKDTEPYTR